MRLKKWCICWWKIYQKCFQQMWWIFVNKMPIIVQNCIKKLGFHDKIFESRRKYQSHSHVKLMTKSWIIFFNFLSLKDVKILISFTQIKIKIKTMSREWKHIWNQKNDVFVDEKIHQWCFQKLWGFSVNKILIAML